jgi:hypothetical protein
MGYIKELVKKLSDPTLTWNITRAWGGWVRWGTVSTSNPQLLHICDEIICMPTRFSEYLYWQDGSGNLVSRIFPNHAEAWDHTNETNPNTSAPYDGQAYLPVGYSGFWGWIDLTDGTSKARVYIGKRTYPELQILIFNTGTITIRVNDPPAGFGLSKYTTGTSGTGYTDISQNQYVVFYKSTQPGVDTTNKVFAQSPLGSSKRYPYEVYYRYGWGTDIGFNLYTGIKAPKDILADASMLSPLRLGSNIRSPINTSSATGYSAHFDIYADDPYAFAGTWRGHFSGAMLFFGWADDESGNVKFIVLSKYLIRTNTKCEKQADQYVVNLYDADLDEWFDLYVHKPTANHYSYGQGGVVQTPYTHEGQFFDTPGQAPAIDANVTRIVTPTDTVQEFTSPATTTWTYYDAYALMNCYDKTNECRASVVLGIYTDDTGVSIPSDVRTAFASARATDCIMTFGLQVKPFMDRTLSAGKTYAVLVRAKRFPRTATGTDLLNWAKKKYPYNIPADEWNSLLSVPPFAVALAGGLPPSGSIPFSISGTPAPGQTITVSGTGRRANATVWVVLVDPDTYTVIAKNSGTSDANGNFSVSLTIPTTASAGKTYRLYIVA